MGRVWLYQHRGFDFSPLVAIDPGTGHTTDPFAAWNITSFAVAGETAWICHQAVGRPSSVASALPQSQRLHAGVQSAQVVDYATDVVAPGSRFTTSRPTYDQ